MQKQKHGALRPAIAALFCTLVFALTWIYVPAGLGNVNLGDAAVLLTAWVLGGVWGMLAAGVGAALVDLLAGYTVYAPGTLVIKALMVLVALGVYRLCRRMPARLGYVLSGVAAEAVMIGGYFLYESFALSCGVGTAALSIPMNALQGAVGIVVAQILFAVVKRLHLVEKLGL